MADNFPIDVAQIIALFLESLFYGCYLVSFGMCMYSLLVNGKSSRHQRTLLLSVALLLFLFATLDVAFLLRHILDAFVWYKGFGGAQAELENISYWVNVMKTVCYVAQTSIADAMLIYRCFVVYGRNRFVIVPLIVLWIAGAATEGIACYIEFTYHANALFNTSRLRPFFTSVLSITLVLNTLATFLIAWKIYCIQRRTTGLGITRVGTRNDSLARAFRIIIESGIAYFLSVVVFFIVYIAGNNALYGVSDCVVQVIGISFNLIIIRVDQGHTAEMACTTYPETTSSTYVKSSHRTAPRCNIAFASRTPTDTVLSAVQSGELYDDVFGSKEVEGTGGTEIPMAELLKDDRGSMNEDGKVWPIAVEEAATGQFT